MGLFEKTKKEEKNKTAVFYIDVEEIDEVEFNRLKQWIKENISSTERFTPEWKEDDFSMSMQNLGSAITVGAPQGGPTQKFRFRFKYEEDAMAFKLIL